MLSIPNLSNQSCQLLQPGVGKSCLLLRFSDGSFTTSFIPLLEFWNSVHSDFCNLSNSVMALDMRSRRAKRLLEEHDGENCKGEEEVQAMDNCHRLCPLIAETGNIGFAMQAMHQSKSMNSRNGLGENINVDWRVGAEHCIGYGDDTWILAAKSGKGYGLNLSDVELEVNETNWEDKHISLVQHFGEEAVVGCDEANVESAFHDSKDFRGSRVGVRRV